MLSASLLLLGCTSDGDPGSTSASATRDASLHDASLGSDANVGAGGAATRPGSPDGSGAGAFAAGGTGAAASTGGSGTIDPFELWDGGVPPGPPPPQCLPPCLWDLFVECGWPGAGTPLPNPRTCRQVVTDGTGRLLCDPEAGYLFEGVRFHRDGELCARRSEVAVKPAIAWYDARDRVIAEVSYGMVANNWWPTGAHCYERDQDAGSRVFYDLAPSDPECAWWMFIHELPMSSFYGRYPPDLNSAPVCSQGTCPVPDP